MPSFPCPVCGKMWPNTFQMRKCMQSEACIAKSLAEQKDNSSASRPAYKLDLAAAKAASIKRFDWQTHGIDGAHHSPGGLGSLGVFMLNLKGDAGVIVMKQGSIQSAGEFFCSLLYGALGLAVPQMRVLAEAELNEVVQQLAGVCFTTPGAGDALQSGGTQRGAVFMEFCRGRTLKDPAVAEALRDDGRAPAILNRLGMLVCVDMLVNNFDRTPAVWDHEGNANNVLVDLDGDGGGPLVWGIDQSTARIVDDAPDGTRVADYARRVETAVVEAATGDIEGVATGRVRSFVKKYAGCDMSPAGCAAFHKGVVEAGLAVAGLRDFAGLLDKTSAAFHDAGWGTPGLESISLELLERAAEAIANGVSGVR